MSRFFDTLAGRKVAFIGAGVSHKELIFQFAKAGAQVTLCDRKTEEQLGDDAKKMRRAGVQLCIGPDYLAGLAGQDMILRTPGFAFYTPQLQAAGREGAEITSEMELFFAHCPCPIVGVTGSDGKTTTTSLIAALHTGAGHTVHLGGNIGKALLPIVDTIAEGDIAVVELSSFQLISMRQSPKVAVVTNVSPNHLDVHRDMEEYVDAKRNILAWQQKNGIVVLGYENATTRAMQRDAAGRVRWFSRLRPVQNGAFLAEDGMLCLAENGEVAPVLPAAEVALRGLHNIENVLAAFAATAGFVPPAVMAEVARSFTGVEHRIEPVRTLNGVQWFNDSIATSPSRVMAGLRAFGQKLVLIAGGYDKNLDYAPMVPEVLQRVKVLILMGPTAKKIEDAVVAHPEYPESGLVILRAKDMADAVQKAHAAAQPGDIVTLSPASASFDAYDNFEERGRHYKQLVNAL